MSDGFPYSVGGPACGDDALPLIVEPQQEGGYSVTSPALPELLTEGETVHEALANGRDALDAVIELYQDGGRPLPTEIRFADPAVGATLQSDVTEVA